jgi:hypothetical protein
MALHGWMRRLAPWLLGAAVACGLPARAQELRDPPAQTFIVWPNIPVVRAADLGDYEQDRKAFADLHGAKGDPAQIVAALQAVDSLQAHHEGVLAQFGRTLSAQFIGEIDRQTRAANPGVRRLRFDFAGITPAELQRASSLDEKALDALKAKAGQVVLAAYITYTRLDGSLVQGTATLVRLGSGASQSFTVTAPATLLGESLARDVFDYFQGTRFAAHRNPLPNAQWLTAAPGHAGLLVSRRTAQGYCQSQGADLPTASELEAAQASGFHGGGVVLQPDAVYHIQDGLYDAAAAVTDAEKVRANYLANVPNGYYYCIRRAAAVRKAPRSKAPHK